MGGFGEYRTKIRLVCARHAIVLLEISDDAQHGVGDGQVCAKGVANLA